MSDYKHQFDEIAAFYDEVRPRPPFESMEVVKNYANLDKNSKVLEVGVGTGQATQMIADMGCQIIGIELGENLAKVAQQNFAANPKVKIINSSFEDWQPQPSSFDLFLCVQAFHWMDTTWGLDIISTNLKSGGSLAIMWHIDRSSITDFYKTTNPVYDRFNHLMVLPTDKNVPLDQRPTPNNWDKVQEAIETHDDFEDFKIHRLNWKHHLDKDCYLKLLQTFSNHNLLRGQDKVDFYKEISAIIDDFGGTVTRIRETVTLLAKRI